MLFVVLLVLSQLSALSMIQLECSNCKAVLAIDDAFAGGVCRCQHCGTIQTVPKPGKDKAAAADSESPKALFKRKARIESALSPYNDGLDRAADEMDSSGGLSASAIAGAAMRRSSSPVGDDTGNSGPAGGQGRAQAAVAAPPTPKAAVKAAAYVPTPSKSAQVVNPVARKKTLVVASAVGGGVILALAGLLAIFAASGDEETQTAESGTDNAQVEKTTRTLKVSAPGTVTGAAGSISGIPLRGASVVYVLDRSGVTQHAFQDMANLCFTSARTLGSERNFQMVVWNNHKPLAFPADRPASATIGQIEEARLAISDTYAGASNLTDHLKSAVAAGAEDIVILSAVDADEQLAGEIGEALKGSSVRLHAIAIGTDLDGRQMRSAAQQFGGEFRQVGLDTIN